MTGCKTYQLPDMELTKEEEIGNLVRNLHKIRPLLKKYENMEENSYQNDEHIMSKDDFSNLWYYKYKNLYFYHELLEKLDGDKEKLEKLVADWVVSDEIVFE